MRLLHVASDGSLALTKYMSEPPTSYAILSHTWGTDEDEVTFKELEQNMGTKKTGYAKLMFCAEKARRDVLEYFWVDTCCIGDVKGERAAALQSMFKWYQQANKCYAYLEDVVAIDPETGQSKPPGVISADLRKSKWFTRGWTLQELLAPKVVEFFSKDGVSLGNKESLKGLLHQITGIPVSAICGGTLSKFTATEKFLWGARRMTKHPEDQAFCLLGIFDVKLEIRRTEQGKAFAELLSRIGLSGQKQYSWNVWPSLQSSLGGHSDMLQGQHSELGKLLDDQTMGPLVKLIQLAVYLMEHLHLSEAEELLKYGKGIAETLQESAEPQATILSWYIRFFYSRLGNAYWAQNDHHAAEKMYLKAFYNLPAPGEAVEQYQSFVYETYNNLGKIYATLSREGDAEKLLEHAVEGRQKLAVENAKHEIMDVIWLVRSLNNLGILRHRQRDFVTAEALYQRALSALEELATENQVALQNTPNLAALEIRRLQGLEKLRVCVNMARLYSDDAFHDAPTTDPGPLKQRCKAFKKVFNEAIREWEGVVDEGVDGDTTLSNHQRTNPHYLHAQQALGVLHSYLGENAVALPYFQRAFDGRCEAGNVLSVCGSAVVLAMCHAYMGAYDSALEVLGTALQIADKGLPADEEHVKSLKNLKEIITSVEVKSREIGASTAAEEGMDAATA